MKDKVEKEDCSKVFGPFIDKDFSNWKVWNSDCIACCLEDFFICQTETISGYAGSEYVPAQFAYYKAKNYQQPVRIWYRSGKFLKLDAEFPDIDLLFPDQFKGLDHAVTKMDYSFGGTTIRNGEWIYPDQGISFFFNGDHNRIIKVMVFLPVNIDIYIKEIRTNTRVREF
jgi:hypothetical protein